MATVKKRRDFLAGLSLFTAATALKPDFLGAGPIDTRFAITNESSATPEEINSLEKMLTDEAFKIKKFLGPQNTTIGDKIVKVRVTEQESCLSRDGDSRPYLQVPIFMYRNKMVPTAHELTHVIAWNGSSRFNVFLGEGMATYAQNRLGKFYANPDFGFPFEVMTLNKSELVYGRRDPPGIREAISLMELKYDGIDDFVRKRWIAYLMAGSFAQYLVEERMPGKMDDIMQLYYNCNSEEDWICMTGVSFNDEENAWREYIHKKADSKQR